MILLSSSCNDCCFFYFSHLRQAPSKTLALILEQGVSLADRDLLLEQAIADRNVQAASLAVSFGVSLACRERACLVAVRREWWGLVQQLVELGVGRDTRNAVFTAAVKASQVCLV